MYKQHGDVLVKRVAILPNGLKKAEYNGKIVLAEGETHNHCHAIADIESATLYIDEKGIKYLDVTSPVTLVHEEHSPITIDIGQYEIGIVQEYDHFAMEARDVRD